MTQADTIIASGDAKAVLRMALAARYAAEEGRFCQCAEPALTGRDLMCGECLLENEAQREQREREIREPHAFEPDMRTEGAMRLGWCAICSRPETDARHR